ncbi:cytochrome c1 [Hyphomonas sp. FCG-A18]|jgi:ubiquinol-cytochrome c reductase cytochrome c1 subunit|uniref:cytochrome c1 n=1 Tax=Hyphomonas sp. FCG-A18 TaxID=3080019 RepID=UPI002B2DFA36|nr:cytochrome c1 [Hyphomonas sp. FCG-A18]
MKLLRTLIVGLGAASLVLSAHAAGGSKKAKAPEGGWAFAGPLGELEMDSVARGYQVYREVCAACHGMKLLSYRNLGEKGGPFYDPKYPNANDNPLVKAFAAEDEILDPNPDENGDPVYRPARPSDPFRYPYANEQLGRAANGGAYPPDLSVITKARGKGNDGDGASYVYSLLKGYPDPDTIKTREGEDGQRVNYIKFDKGDTHGTLIQPIGQYYNPYMAGDSTAQWEGDPRHVPYGGFLAMAPQLTDGRVEYMDGTEATVQQMAYDVAQFLHWAGDPKQSQRKTLGLPTMIYLLLLAVLLWFSYKRIWRNVKH